MVGAQMVVIFLYYKLLFLVFKRFCTFALYIGLKIDNQIFKKKKNFERCLIQSLMLTVLNWISLPSFFAQNFVLLNKKCGKTLLVCYSMFIFDFDCDT